MNRLRLIDFRTSRGAPSVGTCQGDIASVAQLVNTAQRRLVFAPEAGDTGWWGSWIKMVFNVSRTAPFITLPRDVARIIAMDVCQHPTPIQNQFYEYLAFSPGLQPSNPCCGQTTGGNCQFLQTYDRGTVVTFADLTPPRKAIRVYMTNASDSGLRVLIQGKDVNGQIIYTEDGTIEVQGVFLNLIAPFVQTPMEISELTGIQKDVTTGPVQFWQVDLDTGIETLLLAMEPGEQVASYRRYQVAGLPFGNCPVNTGTSQVSCLAKMELIPAKVDTDYLLIQNLEALVEEVQAVRYGDMDSSQAAGQSIKHHRTAIGLLNGELTHYLGKDKPAIYFAPFGSAHLRKQRIGQMI